MNHSQNHGDPGRRAASPSSASGLSSPPRSSPEGDSPPSAQIASEMQSRNSSTSITVNTSAGAFGQLSTEAPTPPARKKPGRKPQPRPSKAADGSSATNTDAPKTRKPRKPRDPNAVPRSRKKNASLESTIASSEASRQPKIPDAAFRVTPPELNLVPAPQPQPQSQSQSQSQPQPQPQPQPQNGNSEVIRPSVSNSFFSAPPPAPAPQTQTQPQPTTRTSGQNYDPIRNYDPVRETVVTHNSYNNSQGSPIPPPHVNRASASPSISSLVDPPNQPLTSPSAHSFFIHQQQAKQRREDGQNSVPPSPTVNRLAPSVVEPPNMVQHTFSPRSSTANAPSPPLALPKVSITKRPEVATVPINNSTKKATGSTATSSAAASPKPLPKSKEPKDTYPTPPPLPGSGLMQLGGMGGGPSDGTEFRAPTVVLSIPMQGEVNKYVNFTRLAEERYGWDALHPRLAAQRDRLARVAAAGAALERNGSGKESGDEMSLDSEGEGSNVEMAGMSDGRTGTDGGPKKVPRKRKMKEDDYDKDDGFVDDSELLWEEQAAAASDGFFVYSGPLVPEGEKPALELRADGIPKRGRGGRGPRGGTSRSTATRGGTTAATGPRGGPLSGPGSRGGSTTRKPRITKADRARMEQEKLDRAKMGSLATMPGGYGGMLASAATMGGTPMVFNQ